MELPGLLRRHFFLVTAVAVLVLMVVAGVMKIGFGSKGGQGGGAQASQGSGGGGRSAPTMVTVAVVQPRPFNDAIEVLGVAKGRQSVTLSAATTQLVDKVLFHEGQTVGRGAVLVVLKASEQDAGLVQAEAKLIQADREYQRWKSLEAKGFASKSAVDLYQAAWLSAQADVTAAKARQGDRTIRAPFGGTVGLSDVAPGALINPGAPIVTLDDLSTIRVDFQVPERNLAQISLGQEISGEVDAYPGQPIHGRIALIDTRIDERTRAVTARAEFPNPGQKLKPGMMVRVAITRGQRQGLSAPESAVSVQGDSSFVYVLHSQGPKTMAEQRPVVVGVRQDGFAELKEGVSAGDRIVADGLNKLQPGQPVRVLADSHGGPQLGGGAAGRPAV